MTEEVHQRRRAVLDGSMSNAIASTGENLPMQWEEDGLTVTRSCAWSAPGCHGGCGVLLYTDENGDLVKIEGDEDNPFSQGRLCVRCLDLKEAIYSPTRIVHPLKRAYEDRGKDKWEQISWDEAYDIVVSRFSEIREKYGAETVLFAGGTGRDFISSQAPLMFSYGSPQFWYPQTGVACMTPRSAACLTVMGGYCIPDVSVQFQDRYNPATGWKPPKTLVIWGNNPLIANADGNFGHWMTDLMKYGCSLVVVDPRLTWLAAQADCWLRVRNGTDCALAMAIIDVLIKEDLYDHDFVDKWCYGFDELAAEAAKWDLDRAEGVTWVPRDKIVKAARLMAEGPMSIQWGLALDHTRECIPGAMAVCDIWCLTGNIDIPGGMVTVKNPFDTPIWHPPVATDYMTQEQAAKQIGIAEYPMVRDSGFACNQPDLTYQAMLTDKPFKIRATYIQTTNPLSCCSQLPEDVVLPAFQRVEFNVVVDYVMTPTAMAVGDVFLPCAMFAERPGIRAIWHYLQAMNPAVDVDGYEVKSDHQINFELGKLLAPEHWPWDSVEEWFSNNMKKTGYDFEGLQNANWLYPEAEYYKYEKGHQRADGKPGFNTPTGRVELWSALMASWDLFPTPQYKEPDHSPYSTPDEYKDYPLIMATGARDWASFHSEHRQFPRLRALKPNPQVEINPATAEKYGIAEGDWVYIENIYGKIKQLAKITIATPEWMVMVDHAWWFPESDPEALFNTFESNANQLIPTDFGSTGLGANCKSLLCKIYKAD